MNNTADFKVFQASAGSGKTFTLIKEYLKLCLASKSSVANFKHILAITFTNAAANEMKAKIVKTLREIIDSKTVDPKSMEAILRDELNISDKELKSNAQSLMTCIMHDYSNFCVCTIDAFVQKLSRSFAHDLGLPSKYAVSIDTQMKYLTAGGEDENTPCDVTVDRRTNATDLLALLQAREEE